MLTSSSKTSKTLPRFGERRRLSTVVLSRSSRTIHFCAGIGCTKRTCVILQKGGELALQRGEVPRLNLDEFVAAHQVRNVAVYGLFRSIAGRGVPSLERRVQRFFLIRADCRSG